VRTTLSVSVDVEQKRAMIEHDKSQSQIAREALALWLDEHEQEN